eukprot:gene6877-13094_t
MSFDMPEERRVDDADGRAYTQEEFLREYGNLDKWHRAGGHEPPSAAAAPAAPAEQEVCKLFLA